MTRWHVGMLACWHVGMLACWHIGMLACWRVGVSWYHSMFSESVAHEAIDWLHAVFISVCCCCRCCVLLLPGRSGGKGDGTLPIHFRSGFRRSLSYASKLCLQEWENGHASLSPRHHQHQQSQSRSPATSPVPSPRGHPIPPDTTSPRTSPCNDTTSYASSSFSAASCGSLTDSAAACDHSVVSGDSGDGVICSPATIANSRLNADAPRPTAAPLRLPPALPLRTSPRAAPVCRSTGASNDTAPVPHYSDSGHDSSSGGGSSRCGGGGRAGGRCARTAVTDDAYGGSGMLQRQAVALHAVYCPGAVWRGRASLLLLSYCCDLAKAFRADDTVHDVSDSRLLRTGTPAMAVVVCTFVETAYGFSTPTPTELLVSCVLPCLNKGPAAALIVVRMRVFGCWF